MRRNQSLRAVEVPGRQVEVGFALRHHGFRRRLLALALRQCAPRRLYGAVSPCQVWPWLPGVGLGALGVHVGDDLAGGDIIAFIHQFVSDAARELRGHIDLRRLDAPIGAGETVTEARGDAFSTRAANRRPLPLPPARFRLTTLRVA